MAYRELIDLHNHILYGMDDGAASLEESAEIARQFVSEGVTRIAATPHFNADNPADRRGPDAAMVRMRVSELGLALEQENVPLSILPGNEVYLTVDVPALVADGIVCRLGDGPGLLVELSLMSNQRPLYLDELVFRLQLDGAQIVLAHPERYPFVDRDVACLDTLVAGGLLLQLTAPALLGEYGPGIRRTAERLLRRGSYSLAASDRHHPGPDRSLAALHERLSETIDVETADLLLCENPARVLEDRPIVSAAPPPKEQPSLFERMLGRRGKE
ncbi:MAG TPA: CpsB/CapC family capsule biosynthesis tyrosine phosphatase [Chloroflexota bacterium]